MRLLVSGASGFLGEAFLAAWPGEVCCVLRGRDPQGRAAGLARRTAATVTGVPGDVRRELWGTEAERVAGISAVVNLASDTAWSSEWHHLHAANVDGARHAVDVAAQLGVPLLHVSSLFVGLDFDGDVPEALLRERAVLSDYERSKCRGEWAVANRAAELGVPTIVARVGGLLGDLEPRPGRRPSARGVSMARLVSGSNWPVIPHADGAFIDIAPRDLVAAMLVEMAAGLCAASPEAGVVVRHVGLGYAAPLVGTVLAEIAVRTRHLPVPAPRPVAVPRAALMQLSNLADRFGRGASSSRLIGLRYLGSRSRYPGSGNLTASLSVAQLVTAMGFYEAAPPPASSYYESWLTAS